MRVQSNRNCLKCLECCLEIRSNLGWSTVTGSVGLRGLLEGRGEWEGLMGGGGGGKGVLDINVPFA